MIGSSTASSETILAGKNRRTGSEQKPERAIETDAIRPKQSPDFGESQNLVPARCKALDHRLALFRWIGIPAANGLDGYEHLAPRRQAEKLFGFLADGF